MFSRSLILPVAALAFASGSLADCDSYGVDFYSGGSYFINTLSNADFTAVTEFDGCQNDTAYISLVDPSGNQYECSNLNLLPSDTPMMTTCDIEQSQMTSGEWELIILSNDGTGAPLANYRAFSIDAAPQVTVTATQTITYNTTTLVSYTSFNTSTAYSTITLPATTTVTVPAKTLTTTSTPAKVTSTSTIVVARTKTVVSKTKTAVYETITPQCTVPPRQPYGDPICDHLPNGFRFPPNVHIPGLQRRADSPLDSESVRRRFEAINIGKSEKAANVEKRHFEKRSADAPTVTTYLASPIESTTVTYTDTTVVYNVTISSVTSTSYSKPKTIHSGTVTKTITAPTPTKTAYSVTHTVSTTTTTWTATVYHITTATPAALVASCKKRGGHFGYGWNGWGL